MLALTMRFYPHGTSLGMVSTTSELPTKVYLRMRHIYSLIPLQFPLISIFEKSLSAKLQFVKYSYSALRLQTQKHLPVKTLFQVENTRENVKIYTMNSFLVQNDSLFTSKILPESNP